MKFILQKNLDYTLEFLCSRDGRKGKPMPLYADVWVGVFKATLTFLIHETLVRIQIRE